MALVTSQCGTCGLTMRHDSMTLPEDVGWDGKLDRATHTLTWTCEACGEVGEEPGEEATGEQATQEATALHRIACAGCGTVGYFGDSTQAGAAGWRRSSDGWLEEDGGGWLCEACGAASDALHSRVPAAEVCEAALATYDDNTGSPTWDNLQASNALVANTAIDAAELLLAAMLDPNTGEPIMIGATHLIYAADLAATAFRVLNSVLVAFDEEQVHALEEPGRPEDGHEQERRAGNGERDPAIRRVPRAVGKDA